MYHPRIPLVVLILSSQTHSRFIEPGVVPINPIHLQRRGIDQNVLLENGQEAQKLNAKFSDMNANSPCKTGDSACIAGGFSQCVGGKFVGGPCAQGSKCFAMPLLLKKGTSLGCDTEEDATSRIKNTGATGGLTGTGGDSSKPSTSNSTQANPTGDMNGTKSDSNEKDGDSTGSTGNAAADTNKNSTSMDSSAGSSRPSDASDSGTDEKKKSNPPMDSSSGAADSSDPSASGTDKNDAKNSTDSSDPKSDSGKASEASKNSTSPSDGKEPDPKESSSNSTDVKKNEAPVKGADGEDVEDLSFAKDKSEEKDCADES
ncbi:hypothetical protein PGT21_033437 [Puccinia graminis f. sp. tritici]|uniref:Carbohydrate-binding module family 19 domain-containing protein n=1 Tax=Puccinia graminis f. sp. tritici TaxID=56615 RepID=A0A5B0R8T0_PUCGR|nr:hypothetical protein PGT21_031590 [Puccinia graminis f. sp. tritici]KAA1118204.1 hypothetical protein PGT21_033437 [Puccinia graminis f. sp. tritici]KAA1120631.1 hypothetical protein PGTUg99_013651 [Puccinia graminis f. sp. tritici]KAA1121254.1 hypothetical protein PGTUg99_028912 [Puccinia graminis f. sp. tritici]